MIIQNNWEMTRKAVNPPLIFDRRSDLRLDCGPIAGRTAVMLQHATQLKQTSRE